MADGTVRAEMTCATCHAAPGADGRLIAGKPNAALDLTAMLAPGARGGDRVVRGPGGGRGRVAVSPGEEAAPVRIPDLRPTRWLTHLQADGAVVQRDLVALAIRIETLIITAHDAHLRPPRVVALGLAAYLWSLSASVPPIDAPLTAEAAAGRSIFAAHCQRCHDGPGLTGPPRDMRAIGPIRPRGCRPTGARASTACPRCADSRPGDRCCTTARWRAPRICSMARASSRASRARCTVPVPCRVTCLV